VTGFGRAFGFSFRLFPPAGRGSKEKVKSKKLKVGNWMLEVGAENSKMIANDDLGAVLRPKG
jgi:hypothetical protein